MSDKILLSFIIPVYNVEKYLNECLDSIFNQPVDEDNYEVIVVDDGSTDRSFEILKTYSHHSNYRIITQENGGSGRARNTGMKAAKGSYIYFVDSDDMLLPDTLPVLLDYACKPDFDVIEFRAQTIGEQGGYIDEFQPDMKRIPQSGTGKDVFAAWYEKRSLSPVVWIRLFKRDFLFETPVYFREHIYHQDVEWIYRRLFYAKTVIFYPQMIYSYRRRQNSASTDRNEVKRCFDHIAVVDSLVEFRNSIEDNGENMKYISILGDKAATMLETAINIFCKSSSLGGQREAIFHELKKRRPLLGLAVRKRGWFLYRLTRFMPAKAAFKIYKVM